jgi:hypothetical protein
MSATPGVSLLRGAMLLGLAAMGAMVAAAPSDRRHRRCYAYSGRRRKSNSKARGNISGRDCVIQALLTSLSEVL